MVVMVVVKMPSVQDSDASSWTFPGTPKMTVV